MMITLLIAQLVVMMSLFQIYATRVSNRLAPVPVPVRVTDKYRR